MKKALISGITGQDGSFLAEFLLQKGYEVHGILRRSSSFNTGRIEHLYFDEWVRDMKQKRTINLHYGDMTDSSSLIRIIQQVQPDEIYNLAAQSHVKVSFDVPEYTAETDAIGTLRMLEAVRILGLEKKTRIYQASTSELFGKVQEVPQKETTPFYPRSPYGVAKQYGFWITKNYRESYGMFAVNGILFNHESERRGETFVTRKITLAAARIAQGFQDKLYLGNLDARRDWGYAKDYVECMWLILQHNTPEDFVIATGEMHTVREFATLAFKETGIELRWEGEGVDDIVAFLLAFVSSSLKEKQYQNVEQDTKKQILAALNVYDVKDVNAEYDKYVKEDDLMQADGSLVKNDAAFQTSYKGEIANGRLHVFVCDVDGQTKYVLPIYGAGLWGPIWGYIALNDDKDTVYGVYFSHQGETPGLGAEITTTKFQDQFLGKHVMENGTVALGVEKHGKVAKPDYQVDGISGGTITSKGVDAMIKDCLSMYNSFLTNK